MGLFNQVLQNLATLIGKPIQGREQLAGFRDSASKGTEYSVESMVCESLSSLATFDFTMPVEGNSPRAKFLDSVSDDFIRDYFTPAMSMGFLTGDCVTVPSWNGHSMDNVLVDAGQFAILGANGREITSLVYVVDEKQMRTGAKYTLLRLIELVDYDAQDGTRAKGCHYKTFIAKDGTVSEKIQLAQFPDWAANNEPEWMIPNVDRLLVARYRSFTLDPLHPNAQKGTPVCFGASKPIREIHYLTEQMHNEFGLSEKAIIADKTLFKTAVSRDSAGNIIDSRVVMPKGHERLFMDVASRLGAGEPMIKEWAPTIQLQPYVDALEKQYQEVEKCVGVSSGILSNLNDQSYQNVDNVRKSTLKTQSFVNTARKVAESYLDDMVYAWNVIANFYGLTPLGDYHVEYKWSDEYINTFSDQFNALLSAQAVGATDAVDIRQFVMGESPEVARENVARIKSEGAYEAPSLIPVEPTTGVAPFAPENVPESA